MKALLAGVALAMTPGPAPAPIPAMHATPAAAQSQAGDLLAALGSSSTASLLANRNALLTAPRENGGSELAGAPAGAADADTFVYPLPAPDLDGDGKRDVLTIEGGQTVLRVRAGAKAQGDYTLRARRGTDAQPLWSASPVDLVGTMDVTGDQAPEIVTLSDEVAGTASAFTDRQTIRVLQSSDGATLWSRTFDAAASRAADTFTGLVVGLQPMTDATGDGRADFFVLSWDQVSWTSRVAGRILDGRTGADFARIDAISAFGFPAVVPVGDLSGDGLADVLTFSAAGTGGILSAQAADGPAVYWAAAIPANAVSLRGRDLTGDGVDDILLYTYPAGVPGPTCEPRDVYDVTDPAWLAYNGLDGSSLWTHHFGDPNGFLFTHGSVGDIDGDGAGDLMALRAPGGYASCTRYVLAETWSGRTGATIWSRRFEGWGFCFCPWVDLTGDALPDALLDRVVFDESGRFVEWWRAALDGGTGAIRWTAGPFADPFTYETAHPPYPIGGDANGNGTQDVYEFGLAPDRTAFTLALHDGGDYTPVWDVHRSGLPSSNWAFRSSFGADLSGDTADEIVISVVRAGATTRWTAEAYRPSGRLWSIP